MTAAFVLAFFLLAAIFNLVGRTEQATVWAILFVGMLYDYHASKGRK